MMEGGQEEVNFLNIEECFEHRQFNPNYRNVEFFPIKAIMWRMLKTKYCEKLN